MGMGWIQLMPLNSVSGGGISGYVNSSLYCNKEGKRYVAEDERRDVLAAAALAQTESCSMWCVTRRKQNCGD